METYAFNHEELILIDPEFELIYQERFPVMQVPMDKEEGASLRDGSVLRLIQNDDGLLEEAFLEKDGQRHGQSVLYYPNGRIKMEVYYNKDKLHGPSVFYQESGSILSKGWYINGKQQGKSWWYYPSGALCSLQRFMDGVWHGNQEYYYENGLPRTLVHYTHGKLDGTSRLYAVDGRLEREIVYSL